MNTHVVQGSIFTDIGKFAEKLDASAIIMALMSKRYAKGFWKFCDEGNYKYYVPFVQDNA